MVVEKSHIIERVLEVKDFWKDLPVTSQDLIDLREYSTEYLKTNLKKIREEEGDEIDNREYRFEVNLPELECVVKLNDRYPMFAEDNSFLQVEKSWNESVIKSYKDIV